MTEKEAKKIFLEPCYPNVAETLQAIDIARSVLGEDCTMAEIWAWAERDDYQEKIDDIKKNIIDGEAY